MAQSFWGEFKITGTVIDEAAKKPRPGLIVEAWDGSDLNEDFLRGATDAKGQFEITVDRAALRDFGKDYRPEIYVVVFDGAEFLFLTDPR